MTNKQKCYNYYRKQGFTEAGAVGMVANNWAESNCEPNRLQNDYSSFRTASKDYTARVTSGAISRYTFGTDQRGYGLAQWTYVNDAKTAGRKFDLYDFWQKSGKALDDLTMQLDFTMWELKNHYSGVLNTLKTSNDLYTCTNKVLWDFEKEPHNLYKQIGNCKDQYPTNKRTFFFSTSF